MVSKDYIPDRGDIIWLNFGPGRGHEQLGRRPALIISSSIYNIKSGLALACPITSKFHQYAFEVKFNTTTINGAIMVDQLKSIDWQTRRVKFEDRLDGKTLEIVNQLIMRLIS